MRRAAATLVLFLAAPRRRPSRADPLQQDLRNQLRARLEAIAGKLDGVLGYVVVDLTSKETMATRLETQQFPTASTIKLAILYELLKQAEDGKLVLDKPERLERAQVTGGSGVLQHLTNPVLSLHDYAALMIILSDNTATNVVIDAVGMANVNARMKTFGLGDILLRRKMMDAAAVARGDENVASPASLQKSIEHIWRADGLKKESREAGLRILYQVPACRSGTRFPHACASPARPARSTASAPKPRSSSSRAGLSRSQP